jgi:alkyl hydroperoxide reductase subunit AhpC
MFFLPNQTNTMHHEPAPDPAEAISFGPYPLTEERRDDLAKRFTYHPPKATQPERYEFLRDHAHMLAVMICENTPAGREQATAITHLETACFFANAAIARNE